MKINSIILAVACCGLAYSATAGSTNSRTHNGDTIEVNFGEKGKILINVDSQEDLEALKKFDFNSMLQDVKVPSREELTNDQKVIMDGEQGAKYQKDSLTEDSEFSELEEEFQSDGNYNNQSERTGSDRDKKHFSGNKTQFASILDWGINNFLQEGSLPVENEAQYVVRPWGSWYIGIMPSFQTHITGKLALEYGLGISWYNFKFRDPRTRLVEGPNDAYFTQWDAEMQASLSKLTVAHFNVHLVPVLDFGYRSRTKTYEDGFQQKRIRHQHNGFRIGAGAYAGTRFDNYTKLVWRETGYRSMNRLRDDYFMDNFRYGLRGIIGVGVIDFFFNYDLNPLFSPGRGPELNPFTFGLSI